METARGSGGREAARMAVVRMPGIVDVDAVGTLEYCLEQAIQAGVRHAVFDLSETTELKATAVRRVVDRRRWLVRQGGNLAIVAGGELARLVRAKGGAELPVLPSHEAAQAFFTDGGAAVVAGASRSRRLPQRRP